MRHVERWIAVHGVPPGKAARRMRRERAAGIVAPPPLESGAHGRAVMPMPMPPDEWSMLPPRDAW